MSAFDVNTTILLNTQFTDANDTVVTPIDEGEYTAVIEKTDLKSGEKNGKTWLSLEVVWSIDDEGQRAKTGRDKLTCRQNVFLDLTDHGTMDMGKGKNVGLGRLREAVGQNQKGKPWSFGMLAGQVATVLISQRVADDGQIFNDIRKVAPLK